MGDIVKYGINLNLHRATNLIDKVTNKLLKDENLDLSNSQYLILKAIYLNKKLNQHKIGKLLGISDGAVSRHVFNLKENGLIELVLDNNSRRNNSVSLTLYGKSTFEKAFKITRINIDRILKKAAGSQDKDFKEMLYKFNEALDEYSR